MEAANRGAHDVCAPSIGFNITLPHEQVPNPYTTPELIPFSLFRDPQDASGHARRALVVFPGGFGTLDEMFEILTLRQTARPPRSRSSCLIETIGKARSIWMFSPRTA
jgi:predicted Rossmann-fold nucleotide-binding protein